MSPEAGPGPARPAALPRTVLVLAPMAVELQPLARRLRLRRDRRTGDWSGTVGATRVVLMRAGVGTARARRVAELGIRDHRPDHVVVAGVAGGLGESLPLASLVVPAVVHDIDDGTRHVAAPLGAVVPEGALVTSATMHGWDVLAPHAGAGALAVDMETSAVAAVCEHHAVPWTAVRALSDLVREGQVDAGTLALVREDGSTDLAAVARYLARRPSRVVGMARMGRDTAAATAAVADTLARALA